MSQRQEPATGRRGVDAPLPPAHPPHGARMYAVPLPTGQGGSMKFPPETRATGSPVCNAIATPCAMRHLSPRRAHPRVAHLSRRRVVSLPARR